MKGLIKEREKLFRKESKVKQQIDDVKRDIRGRVSSVVGQMNKAEWKFGDSKIKRTKKISDDMIKDIEIRGDVVIFSCIHYYMGCGNGSFNYEILIPERYFTMKYDEIIEEHIKLCQSVLDRNARNKKLKKILA
jgi:hypothetical protein